MRSTTFVVRRPDGTHPAYRLFGADSGLTRERIYNFTLLADGTLILLGRLRGDLDRARDLIEAESEILGYSITPVDGTAGDGTDGMVYVHARPPPEVERFLGLPREHEVFFEFPIEGTRDGGFRVVMVGETDGALQAVFEDLPPELDVDVERVGDYPPSPGDLAATLTDRQREVLSVAAELGYYEVPRRATHRDIADRLGLSVGTVGEHLQKIEARILGRLAE